MELDNIMIDSEVENLTNQRFFEDYFMNDHSCTKENHKGCFYEDIVLLQKTTGSVDLETHQIIASSAVLLTRVKESMKSVN